ncbi:hypothetical protein J3E68DRAFT_88244 [Trichoderma sp. SZMC 28012]
MFPLNQPCEHQFCGHGDQLFEFIPCGKTFTTIKEQDDHMRSQVRTMQKNGASGDKGPTCFFRACARDPEGGRIHREGLDFDSVDDMRDHVWSVHQVYTIKGDEVKFCEYCQTWLIELLPESKVIANYAWGRILVITGYKQQKRLLEQKIAELPEAEVPRGLVSMRTIDDSPSRQAEFVICESGVLMQKDT